jgi:hypothetical protein
MNETTWRERREAPYDGETRELGQRPAGGGRRCARFPWPVLWLIWPLMFVVKGAMLLAGPALAWLSQPVLLTVTPLPLLLIGAGAALLLIDARRRGR